MIIFNRKHKCVYGWMKSRSGSLAEHANFYYRPDGAYVYHNQAHNYYSFCKEHRHDVLLKDFRKKYLIACWWQNDFI